MILSLSVILSFRLILGNLEVLDGGILDVLLHPLPEEGLHAVHIVLLEQGVGRLGEPSHTQLTTWLFTYTSIT